MLLIIARLVMLTLSIMASVATSTYAGGGERGGGGYISAEATSFGRAIVMDLEVFGKVLLPQIDPAKISAAVETYAVSTSEAKPLDSKYIPQNAVTDRKLQTITIHEATWNSFAYDEFGKIKIIFHEYLRAADPLYFILDEHYSISGKYISYVQAHTSDVEVTKVSMNAVQTYRLAQILNKESLVCEIQGNAVEKLTFKTLKNKINQVYLAVWNGNGILLVHDQGEVKQVSVGEEFITIVYNIGDYFVFTLFKPQPEKLCGSGSVMKFTTKSADGIPTVNTVTCCLTKSQ